MLHQQAISKSWYFQNRIDTPIPPILTCCWIHQITKVKYDCFSLRRKPHVNWENTYSSGKRPGIWKTVINVPIRTKTFMRETPHISEGRISEDILFENILVFLIFKSNEEEAERKFLFTSLGLILTTGGWASGRNQYLCTITSTLDCYRLLRPLTS